MSVYGNAKCRICEEEFMKKRYNSACCSKECRLEAKKLEPNRNIKHTCPYCKKTSYGYAHNKYCNRKCLYLHQKEKRKGKGNPSYRNGFYTRGSKRLCAGERIFKKVCAAIKENMITEKGFLYCQHCNGTNTARFECHHIIYRSEKSKHENLHDERNVIHLCIKCHNEFHKKKHEMRETYIKDRKLKELFN